MGRVSAAALLAALALAACARTDDAPDPAVVGKAFLAKNAHAPGVTVTADGLQYRVLRSGPATGLRPKPADEVKFAYEGKFIDGRVFDSSYDRGVPAVTTLRDLTPGFREALALMRPGDQWLIYVPAKLGYGEAGAGPIPPNSVLVFKVDLIAVQPDQSSIGKG
ncbi:MAG TPA: FKBP-type peptidyl-prolyl cis-trans isomerase [Caulobacteraceae bacterium]|jgi:peptidylprolyl isomerase/FKBP-type peptidyl-prolyl cis-trans isomerase FklB|nr:FKBP-type peptidyl-prolyl cis-trans isomerase [Caulobacteraceae bacterium]